MDTPKYVFKEEILQENYKNMQKNLPLCEIHFALKSNANMEVLCALHNMGSSFECASVNEFDRLHQIGVNNDKIIFGLPIKTEDIINHVYSCGGRYFVFDDMRELIKLERLAPDAKKILRIYVSDLVPLNIGYGMTMEQIENNEEDNQLLSHIDGISFHISNNINIENERKVLDRAEEILKQIIQNGKTEPLMNIGGSYRLNPPDAYFEHLNERLRSIKDKYLVKLIAEPGLAIVDSAGSFFTRVIMTKKQEVFTDVYIDGGAPNGINKMPAKVNIVNKAEKFEKTLYRFIDITCLNQVLFMKRLPININDNDILEFTEMGAYTLVHQNDFHLWDRSKVEVI